MEMKIRLLLVPVLLVTVAALAAGCGGGSQAVPADAVATVGSTPITKTQFQALMTLAAARYKAQGQAVPKVGTAAYSQLRDQAVTYLVNEEELRQEADKLGVKVTDQDVSKYLDTVKQTYYHGSEKKFEDALKADHITLAELEQYNIRPTLLSQKLQAKVSSSANVSTADAKRYYDQNKTSYGTPAETTRSVRHILVDNKNLANQLEQKLKQGASFAALAKKYSKDTGSAQQGGKLTAVKGQLVKPFQDVAFSLKTGQTSPPVHSQYGWHIIQALGPVKKTAAHTQPFSQVEAQIKLQLAQQKKQLAWSNFLAKVKKDYQGKIAYQTGYTPATTTTPAAPAPTTTG
jgi:parvulin-like peptidyl-prolyl isomerase